MSVIHSTRPASTDEIAAEMDRRGKVIERLEADLAEAGRKVEHLAKQEVDIRAAYELRRASEGELARENKRLDREWEASIEQAKYWQGVAERALAKQAAPTVDPRPFAETVFYMIEMSRERAGDGPAHWWSPTGWRSDWTKAARFGSREDAERIRHDCTASDNFVSEHVLLSARVPAALEGAL